MSRLFLILSMWFMGAQANAAPCDWFILKAGLNLDSTFDSLCVRLRSQFPHGSLAGDLLRHFAEDLRDYDSPYAQGFLEAEFERLKEGVKSPALCRRKISVSHWLSHVYEYLEQYRFARSIIREMIADPHCQEVLTEQHGFYEFGILGHYNIPPIRHLMDHLRWVTETD